MDAMHYIHLNSIVPEPSFSEAKHLTVKWIFVIYTVSAPFALLACPVFVERKKKKFFLYSLGWEEGMDGFGGGDGNDLLSCALVICTDIVFATWEYILKSSCRVQRAWFERRSSPYNSKLNVLFAFENYLLASASMHCYSYSFLLLASAKKLCFLFVRLKISHSHKRTYYTHNICMLVVFKGKQAATTAIEFDIASVILLSCPSLRLLINVNVIRIQILSAQLTRIGFGKGA